MTRKVKRASTRVRRRASSKRTTSKRKEVPQHSVLNEALIDISRELTKLRRDKVNLSKKVDKSDKDLINVQNTEVRLRDRISRLIADESQLNKSKGTSQAKLLSIKEKIAKIKKVQEELRDI